MLAKPDFLAFLLISLVVAGLMQFYFLGTGRFMQDMGISGKVIPGHGHCPGRPDGGHLVSPGVLRKRTGIQVDPGSRRRLLGRVVRGVHSWPAAVALVVSQSFHGLAYVLFIIAGQLYANSVAPENIRALVQAMVFAATWGSASSWARKQPATSWTASACKGSSTGGPSGCALRGHACRHSGPGGLFSRLILPISFPP